MRCKWAPEESKLLKLRYATTPMHELLELFPGKTQRQIYDKARVLNIKRRVQSICETTWTPEELSVLREKYPVAEWPELLKLLPHRSGSSIKNRANMLGLKRLKRSGEKRPYKCGCPGIKLDDNTRDFLNKLLQLNEIARDAGKKVNVMIAMNEWAKLRRDGSV